MSVTVKGAVYVGNFLRNYLRQIEKPSQKQTILKAGALVVRRKVKSMLPKRKDRYTYTINGRQVVVKKPFYYYLKGKGKQGLMIKGNLANSIYAFRTRIGEVEVGPRRLRRIAEGSIIGGTPQSSSGYYASSLLKSAQKFRQNFTERAYTTKQTQVLKKMEKAFERIHKKILAR